MLCCHAVDLLSKLLLIQKKLKVIDNSNDVVVTL